MRLNDALPKEGSQRRPRRVGRGISAGQGASCGFGMRGQKSRSGRPTRPGFEGGQMPLYRRLPKLKHFPLVNQKNFTIINVEDLASLAANSEVTLSSLIEAGIITSDDGPLKVLGNGELGVPLTVKAAAFTATARAKIEAAKGTVEVLENQSNRALKGFIFVDPHSFNSPGRVY
jgi:large subunit ribosomal protein L15